MPEPNAIPNQQDQAGGGAAPAGGGQAQPAQPSLYKDLQAKKGFKSEEDLAKSYVEAESAYNKHQNITNKVKQQLESAGYTMDEEGNIKPAGQPSGYPPQGQPSGYPPQGGYPPQQPQEIIYDPYTGTPITDPIALQLARMPVGHREAFIVNTMLEQREKQQSAALTAEYEIINTPEAKGFEDDVRKVMNMLPLAQRANKEEWKNALLRVKGARYDQDKKNWGQQGVEEFINKDNNQLPQGGTGGQGAGSRLSPEHESIYQYYQQNHPGMFKDRAHFARSLSPTGGR